MSGKALLILGLIAVAAAFIIVPAASEIPDNGDSPDSGYDAVSAYEAMAAKAIAKQADEGVFNGYYMKGYSADAEGKGLVYLIGSDGKLKGQDISGYKDGTEVKFVEGGKWVFQGQNLVVVADWGTEPGKYKLTFDLNGSKYVINNVAVGDDAPAIGEALKGDERLSDALAALDGWYLTGVRIGSETAANYALEWSDAYVEDGRWAVAGNMAFKVIVDNAYLLVFWDNGVNLGTAQVRFGEPVPGPMPVLSKDNDLFLGFYTSDGVLVAGDDGKMAAGSGFYDDGVWSLDSNLDLYTGWMSRISSQGAPPGNGIDVTQAVADFDPEAGEPLTMEVEVGDSDLKDEGTHLDFISVTFSEDNFDDKVKIVVDFVDEGEPVFSASDDLGAFIGGLDVTIVKESDGTPVTDLVPGTTATVMAAFEGYYPDPGAVLSIFHNKSDVSTPMAVDSWSYLKSDGATETTDPSEAAYTVATFTVDSFSEYFVYDRSVARTDNVVYQTLKDALDNAKAGSLVTMINDGTIGSTYTITGDMDFTLDLNGRTISEAGGFSYAGKVQNAFSKPMFIVEGRLAITDGAEGGKVVSAQKAFILNDGGEVTMDSGTVTGSYAAFYVLGDISKDQDKLEGSSLTLNGGTLEGPYTVVVQGKDATFTMNGGTVECTSDQMAISGNGSNRNDSTTHRWGTVININGGTVTAPDGAGIYHPQGESVVNITGGTIEAQTALAVKGGTVTISGDAYVHSTGPWKDPSDASNTGTTSTGDGIYIEGSYAGHAPKVLVEGGTVVSDNGKAVNIKPNLNDASMELSGGCFMGCSEVEDVAENLALYAASGYAPSFDSAKGMWTVKKAN